MKAIFIESSQFTETVSKYMTDEAYAHLQQQLMNDPRMGAVMPGCGGLRKVRIPDPKRGKGKRSGARVIYLYVDNAKWFHMLDIFDKDEKEDLSVHEKKILSLLVAQLKREAKSETQRSSRKKQ